jgi:hypothetical protein
MLGLSIAKHHILYIIFRCLLAPLSCCVCRILPAFFRCLGVFFTWFTRQLRSAQAQILRLRSGFRLRPPAALTPAARLKLPWFNISNMRVTIREKVALPALRLEELLHRTEPRKRVPQIYGQTSDASMPENGASVWMSVEKRQTSISSPDSSLCDERLPKGAIPARRDRYTLIHGVGAGHDPLRHGIVYTSMRPAGEDYRAWSLELPCASLAHFCL